MPFRITAKNVLQFTVRRRTVDSAKKKIKGKFLKGMFVYAREDDSKHINLSTVPMTQPKANGNVFSFDYVISEMVNVAAVQPSSHRCTWEVC